MVEVMSNKCCYECKRRKVGCHSDCEDYKKFCDEMKEISNNRKKESISRTTIFRSKYFK